MTLPDIDIAAAVAEAKTAPTETLAQVWRESIIESVTERRYAEIFPDDVRVVRMWAVNVAAGRLLTKPEEVIAVAERLVAYVVDGPVTP